MLRLPFLSESLLITSQEDGPDSHRWVSSMDCSALTGVLFYRLGLLGLVPLSLCVATNWTLLETQVLGVLRTFTGMVFGMRWKVMDNEQPSSMLIWFYCEE